MRGELIALGAMVLGFVGLFALGILYTLGIGASGPAPTQDNVVGYVDTTDLGFTEAHYYEIQTPDGTIPCIVTESPEDGAGAGIDCDWTDKQ